MAEQEVPEEELEELEYMRGIVWDNLQRTTDDLPFPGQPPYPIKPSKKKRWTIFRKKEVKRKPL